MKHACPVCGKYEFQSEGSYDICPVCFWEDDAFQERHPDDTGCNHGSLNTYRARFDSMNREARAKLGTDFTKMKTGRASAVKSLSVRFDANGDKGMDGFLERFATMAEDDEEG